MTTMLEEQSTKRKRESSAPEPRRSTLSAVLGWLWRALDQPPAWFSVLVCGAAVVFIGFVRLKLIPNDVVPLTFGLPLLLCIWNRDRRLLYGMAMIFSGMAIAEIAFLLPDQAFTIQEYRPIMLAMALAEIWVITAVVHALISSRDRLESRALQLSAANQELGAINEALSASETELSHQNEELERQSEELQQQSEELTQQTEEMQALNEELTRRERALQALLDTAPLLAGGPSEPLLNRFCEAVMGILEEMADAVALVRDRGGRFVVSGHHGFGPAGPIRRTWSMDRSVARVVMAEGRTAYVADIQLRPDLEIPQPSEGGALRSILCAPLHWGEQVIGALEAFSAEPREWTERDFRILEWAAAQCATLIKAAEFQQELEARRREMEEASVRKTRFMAAVSHDVRTPANAISLLAELISQSAADPQGIPEVPQLAEDLRVSARALIDLVSDVLDLARFDSGKIDLQLARFDLWSAIDREVRQLAPAAQAKGLEMVAHRPAQRVWIETDRVKLARVLSNLLGNAVKFTAHGRVSVAFTPADDGAMDIRVSDTGMGIPREHLPQVFDEFFQLRNPERDRSKGTGLGLAICKRLVDALGFHLLVESEVGQGSTFTVRIPAEKLVAGGPEPTGEPGGQSPAASAAALRELRILLVEDHDLTRDTAARLLRAAGAHVTAASTGAEAIQALGNGAPQVLLLDLMLPDMDGRDVLQYIQRQRPAGLQCVLAVSGDVTAARIAEISALGADGLVPKPIQIVDLSKAIQAVMSGQHVAQVGSAS